MRTKNRFFGNPTFVEQLEDRQLLSAVINITGSNTATEFLQVHINKGEIKVNRNNVWTTIKINSFDTIVNVRAGTYTAPKSNVQGVPSKGKHTIQIFSNVNEVKEIDIFGTQDSVNYIDENVFCGSRVKAFGGYRSANYITSKVTSSNADVWEFGGPNSSNYLTSLYGWTKMKGGDYSANFITNKVGHDQLLGGNFSSNYLTAFAGDNTFIGGNNSQNVYNINGGTGWMKSGGYSSNTVYTKSGLKPIGFSFNTTNGAFVFRKTT